MGASSLLHPPLHPSIKAVVRSKRGTKLPTSLQGVVPSFSLPMPKAKAKSNKAPITPLTGGGGARSRKAVLSAAPFRLGGGSHLHVTGRARRTGARD